MGASNDCLARFTECFAECNFNGRHVRLYRCRHCPRYDFTCCFRVLWLVAALETQLRLTANMLDGMVAIASSRTSKTGELYNEVPDRISDAAVFIGAGFAWGGNVTLGYIATILAIFTAYVRAAGKIAGAPNEFCGPMAKQHRMLVITLICLYATITPRSWQMIAFNNLQIGLMTFGLVVIVVGCVITVIRRLSRIAYALGA
jgi:phosphatidylglycerophosphate synthase